MQRFAVQISTAVHNCRVKQQLDAMVAQTSEADKKEYEMSQQIQELKQSLSVQTTDMKQLLSLIHVETAVESNDGATQKLLHSIGERAQLSLDGVSLCRVFLAGDDRTIWTSHPSGTNSVIQVKKVARGMLRDAAHQDRFLENFHARCGYRAESCSLHEFTKRGVILPQDSDSDSSTSTSTENVLGVVVFFSATDDINTHYEVSTLDMYASVEHLYVCRHSYRQTSLPSSDSSWSVLTPKGSKPY